MEILIYGASDDLVEVEGAIREEFSYGDDEAEHDLLAFSDGTLLSIKYANDGCWRIGRLVAGDADYQHRPAAGADEDHDGDDGSSSSTPPSYSDVVTLTRHTEEPMWVVHSPGRDNGCSSWARSK